MNLKKFFIFLSMFLAAFLVHLTFENLIVTQLVVLAYMSHLVITPITSLFGEIDYKKRYWIMFGIIIPLMLVWNSKDPSIALCLAILNVIIGFLIIVPITSLINKFRSGPSGPKDTNREFIKNHSFDSVICKECGAILKNNTQYCIICGSKINKDYLANTMFDKSKFSPVYSLSVREIMDKYIEKELVNCNFDKNTKLIPSGLLRRKKILNVLFSMLLFIYISLIFFHLSLLTYIIGLFVLLGFFVMTRKYNLVKYLRKQIKIRPNEKISNVVMNTKASLVPDKSLRSLFIVLPIAIILPLIIFFNPRVFYEDAGDGYAVRFYTFGLTNFTTVTIPETYNGKPIVSLRGNTFSNMPFIKEVTLPDTITEIRGQAFKNDISLEKINIPENLEYLGGGAFYNCKSITSITLPNTLSYMGGEVFYGAKSLENIKLSENLYEIRGNSFQNCSSLKYIEIPNNILRIGGHAFDGNTSLTTVKFTENSKIEEIGSSAFRDCKNLRFMEVPKKVRINKRAFKGSPTIITFFESQDEEL